MGARAAVTAGLAACLALGAGSAANAQEVAGGNVLIQVPAYVLNGVPVFRIVPVTGDTIFLDNGRILISGANCPSRVVWVQNIPILVAGDCSLPALIANLDPAIKLIRIRAGVYRAPTGGTGIADVNRFTIARRPYSYAAPTLQAGGSLMVPLEETLAALGTRLNWAVGDRQASFRCGGRDVTLDVGTLFARVGTTEAWILERPSLVYDGRLYVPASFIEDLAPGYMPAE